MAGTATRERPRAAGDLDDLQLSAEERAEEAAERERELGGSDEAVEFARQQALKAAQEEMDAEDGGSPSEGDEKAQELKDEAGEPVGDMPPGEPQDTSPPVETLQVSGTAQGSRRKWNGKAPGMVLLKVKEMKIEVPEGEFKKGERVFFAGEALIVSEGAEDKLDKDTKTPVEAVQVHKAVVLDFELRDE